MATARPRQTRPATRELCADPDDKTGALLYRIELWTEDKEGIERLLAVTATASIGYSAYFAAVRTYPDRCIVFRHRGRVLSVW